MLIKGTLGALFDPLADLYELGESLIEIGEDALGRVRKEKHLKIADIEEWLVDPDSFVIPVSKITSIDRTLRGVNVTEKDGSVYTLLTPSRLVSWEKKLIKAYEAIRKG